LDTIYEFGWSSYWEEAFAPLREKGLTPGRVTAVYRDRCTLVTPLGPLWGSPSGTLRRELSGAPPAVGDMTALTIPRETGDAVIEELLPRRTAVCRQSVHNVHERQAMAANVDLVAIATSLNRDFNPARLERYMTVAWNSGARPAVVLTKADLCDEPAACLAALEEAATMVPTVTVCAPTGQGLDALRALWDPGETAVVLGSSGVGKSTLLNALMGETVMDTREIREDDGRGRHTTTHRQIFRLPDGRLLIDTPGMREIAFDEEGGAQTFADIEELAASCRFSDCRHQSEPGCAVRDAINEGALTRDRLERYNKFRREERHEMAKSDKKARIEKRQQERAFGRMVRSMKTR
jgi:ribosome biogenesis GTPase